MITAEDVAKQAAITMRAFGIGAAKFSSSAECVICRGPIRKHKPNCAYSKLQNMIHQWERDASTGSTG